MANNCSAEGLRPSTSMSRYTDEPYHLHSIGQRSYQAINPSESFITANPSNTPSLSSSSVVNFLISSPPPPLPSSLPPGALPPRSPSLPAAYYSIEESRLRPPEQHSPFSPVSPLELPHSKTLEQSLEALAEIVQDASSSTSNHSNMDHTTRSSQYRSQSPYPYTSQSSLSRPYYSTYEGDGGGDDVESFTQIVDEIMGPSDPSVRGSTLSLDLKDFRDRSERISGGSDKIASTGWGRQAVIAGSSSTPTTPTILAAHHRPWSSVSLQGSPGGGGGVSWPGPVNPLVSPDMTSPVSGIGGGGGTRESNVSMSSSRRSDSPGGKPKTWLDRSVTPRTPTKTMSVELFRPPSGSG
jgi:hypothetical protein